ncbi:MAG: BatD family protein [Owenweeksia sp.]|nr:BatD family protein [Owenweeksia sp.]
MYQGEPLVASYKLYFTNTKVTRPTIIEEPNFTGFYRKKLKIDRIPTSKENYRGEQYNTGIFDQMVLIPQQSGNLRPGEVQAQIPTQLPTNQTDIFGRRVTRTINQTAAENFPSIEVRPLPERGKPSGFGGAVGDYNFSVTLSRNELSANESITLTVKVSGTGNIKLIEAPEPEIPSAFEAFDPEYEENIRVNAAGMSGTKTYRYLLVPRYGGTYKIPELKFSYFDPRLERYLTLQSEELEVTVTGGTPQPGQPQSGVNTPERKR